MRQFASRRIGKGGIVGSYYGLLVYSNLRLRGGAQQCYGEGMLEVYVGEFRKSLNQLSLEVSVSSQTHSVSMVPATYCVMRFLNDPRYLPT